MIYDSRSGECLETLLRNKRFSAKVCYGWGRLLLSATTLILLTRELHILIFKSSIWYSLPRFFRVFNNFLVCFSGKNPSYHAQYRLALVNHAIHRGSWLSSVLIVFIYLLCRYKGISFVSFYYAGHHIYNGQTFIIADMNCFSIQDITLIRAHYFAESHCLRNQWSWMSIKIIY